MSILGERDMRIDYAIQGIFHTGQTAILKAIFLNKLRFRLPKSIFFNRLNAH